MKTKIQVPGFTIGWESRVRKTFPQCCIIIIFLVGGAVSEYDLCIHALIFSNEKSFGS